MSAVYCYQIFIVDNLGNKHQFEIAIFRETQPDIDRMISAIYNSGHNNILKMREKMNPIFAVAGRPDVEQMGYHRNYAIFLIIYT